MDPIRSYQIKEIEVNAQTKAGAKTKILVLHGRGSNEQVTRMQLENLKLQNSEFDVVYVNGPILEDEPGPGIADINGLVTGPWYSWLPRNIHHDDVSKQTLQIIIVNALHPVLKVIAEKGPFDSIFGFSQGAVVANLLTTLPQDNLLRS